MSATNSTVSTSPEGGNILSGENPIVVSLSDPLPLFMVQTVIILSLCYIINLFMNRIRQPKVVSEVLTGIILGPSILGQIPGFNDIIFPAQSIPFLTLVANLGLVLFLFLVGLELDPKLILKRAKHALGISVAGLLIPFVFSCGVSLLLYRDFEQSLTTTAADGSTVKKPAPPFGEFLLTCGVAMSLTAFPVLARILAEMQLMSTTVGFITVCAAAAGDIVAWILLALLVSLINATTPIMPLYVVLMAIAWCVILVYAVRPLLLSLVRLTHSEEEPSQKMIAITLVVVLTSAFVTNIIGIHAIFGGFLVGLLIPHDSGFAEGLTRRLEDLVGVYFLPIFFACSGLKTNVSLLNTAQTWGLVIMVTAISCFGKMLGCTTAARANGMTWREAFSIGFLMNCKGLVEYIILNIGHDAGVISDRVFVIMIAMCVILTMIATPFVGYLYPVSYQKELEVKREAERKLQASHPKGYKEIDNNNVKEGGFLAKLSSKVRRRRGGKSTGMDKRMDGLESGDAHYEDLDSVQVDNNEKDSGKGDESAKSGQQAWKKRNAIMFCLDKTPNAPGVMTLLQLFSGTALRGNSRQSTNSRSKGTGIREDEKGHQSVLQSSIDISDPNGNTRARNESSGPEYEVEFSNIYAIRLLHISERTSAAMLTASRCMDRLYKDTVMMMVMAFAKLNSVPLKPLVAISTDIAQSTVAQDILDRAEDLNVGWIVYPWNSSHLTDLPSAPTSYPAGNHLQPGVMMSMANTSATAASAATSMPGTPLATAGHDPLAQSTAYYEPSTDNVAEPPLQFPYNISRYFDHDEAQKIASGGHVDLSQGGASHRTSIASNTKVLSKLITSSADSNIATAVLVDRGLGLFGGVEHIVVPLLGGEDDYEALCLASCLARTTRCFVTILRVSTAQQGPLPDGQNYAFQSHSQQTSHSRHFSSDRSVPPTPDHVGVPPLGRSKASPLMETMVVPKDDETLFKKFFPTKPLFQGGHSHHQQRILQRNVCLDRAGWDVLDESTEENEFEEGVMALNFQELGDAIQWSRACLTAQDLMIMGFDSNATSLQHTGQQKQQSGPASSSLNSPSTQNRHSTVGFSRVPSMEGHRQSASFHISSPTSPIPASPPSILERRGINLSPRQSTDRPDLQVNHLRLQPFQDSSPNASTASTPGFTTTSSGVVNTLPSFPRASFDEERSGRPDTSGRSGSRGGDAAERRSRSRGARSARSLSRGRKAVTPGAAADHASHGTTTTSSLTTCQVMLGTAADRIIQSGVMSSLLAVRSRWFSQRKATRGHSSHDVSSQTSGLGHFKLHSMSPGGASSHSHHRPSNSNSNNNEQHISDPRRQYHSQQQQHHERQHSKLSEELTGSPDGVGGSSPSPSSSITPLRKPDVTFAGESSSDAISGKEEAGDMVSDLHDSR